MKAYFAYFSFGSSAAKSAWNMKESCKRDVKMRRE